MHTLINADCLDYLNGNSQTWATIFADPPDNIGLGYQTYKDKLPDEKYVDLLGTWLHLFVRKAKTVWFSYNAKWSFEVGRIVAEMLKRRACKKHCVSRQKWVLCVTLFVDRRLTHGCVVTLAGRATGRGDRQPG